MRKKLFIYGIMIIHILIFTSCDSQNALLSNRAPICSDYEDKISTLPIKVIKRMIAEYRNNQLAAINQLPIVNENDAQAIWFDLETLKKFLYNIESIATKNNSEIVDKLLGVRIYYVSYADSEYNKDSIGLKRPDYKDYAHKHTLLMVPTVKSNGIDYDFNPMDTTTYPATISNQDRILPAPSYNAQSIYSPFIFDDNFKLDGESLNTFMILGAQIQIQEFEQESQYYPARNHGGLFPPGENDGSHFLNRD